MVNYNYEILRLNVAPHKNELDNVVVSVNWRYQITEESEYADMYYLTNLTNDVDSNSFIEYDDLTDETVFSWVSQLVDIDSLQKQLQDKLEEVKVPSNVEKLPPWDMSVKYTGDEEYLIVTDVNDPNNLLKTFGPMKWDTGRVNQLLAENTNVQYTFPIDVIMYQKGLLPRNNVPLNISDNLKLYKVEYTDYVDLDNIFQYHEGLKWVLDTGKAVGTYFVIDRNLEEVKKILHQNLSEKSFYKQIEGAEINIQDTAVNANSDIINRTTLLQRWFCMQEDEEGKFKLNNGEWFTLTKTEVESVLVQINDHIKNIMEWENAISSQINDSVTIEDLKQVEV